MAEDIQTTAATPQEPNSQAQQPNPNQSNQSGMSTPAPQSSQLPAGNKKVLLKKIIKILILLAITGALASAVFFFYQKMQVKKRDAQRKQDLQAIQGSLEKMRQKTQDQKYYPSAISDATLVKTGIMDKLPKDPKNEGPYVYHYNTEPPQCTFDCTNYLLFACLENANDAEGKAPIGTCQTKIYEVTK